MEDEDKVHPYKEGFDGRMRHVASGLTREEHRAAQRDLKMQRPLKAPGRAYTSLPYIEKPVAAGNFDANRHQIKGITIHTTAGGLAGTLGWFNNPQSQVSSNYVIDTDGTIYAMLEEYYVPYTNGNYVSNQECITIEHVDNGKPNGERDQRQIQASIRLVAELCKNYSLPANRVTIKGHKEIPPYTHPECPGNMPVDDIARLAAGGTPAPTPKPTGTEAILQKVRTILSSSRAHDQMVKDIHWATRPNQ